MSQSSRRPYSRPISKTRWWMKKPFYQRYMIREVSCIFIGLFTLLLVYGISRLSSGPEAYREFINFLSNPLVILFEIIALLFSLYHTITWFKLMPQTTPILIGETFLQPWVMILSQYAAWIVISVLILMLAGVF